MKKLPQFRNKSHKEVRRYIFQTKGACIESDFNLGSLMLCILMILVGIVGVVGIVKWLQERQTRKNNENMT